MPEFNQFNNSETLSISINILTHKEVVKTLKTKSLLTSANTNHKHMGAEKKAGRFPPNPTRESSKELVLTV